MKKVKKKKNSPVKRSSVKKKRVVKKSPVKKAVKKAVKNKKPSRRSGLSSAKDKAIRRKHLNTIVAQLREEKLFVQERVEKAKRDEWIGQVNDEIDNAVASTERDILFERVDRLIQRLDEIDNALKKAELKKFGICEKCAMDITIRRLKLIPYARYCYRCISKD
ncbi:MAG: hypothetical protein U9O97_02810 [Elusimicrobiota bacterium]|nr:hypothetical protein [Elusimicrobiota bacterium]